MTRLAYNKRELQKKRTQLAQYQRVLPSLDLKFRQLVQKKSDTKTRLDHSVSQEKDIFANTVRQIPMIGNESIDLAGLVTVRQVKLVHNNELGVTVPCVIDVVCDIKKYSLLAKPHWVDMVAVQMQRLLVLRCTIDIERQRLVIFEHAIKKTLQRINLLQKLLIPRIEKDIHRIQVVLSDMERAAVVRSKMAKAKRLLW